MSTEFPRYTLAVVLPVLSFFSIAVSIIPLALHAKNRNIATTSLILWYILLNTFNIINSLVWPTDDLESAWDGTGLCDVEVKFIVGGYFAVPGALVGIFRGLAIVLDTSRATLVPSRKQRWRNRILDIVFCFLLPVISMVLHVVWQKHRYLLYAISGCVVDLDESWVSFALCFIWPPVICFIAAFYCCSSTLPRPSRIFQALDPVLTIRRSRAYPPSQIPKRLRGHPTLVPKQLEQVPIPAPFVPGIVTSCLHPSGRALYILLQRKVFVALAPILMEPNPRTVMEHNHQGSCSRHSICRSMVSNRCRFCNLWVLRLRPRCNQDLPGDSLLSWPWMLLPRCRSSFRLAK